MKATEPEKIYIQPNAHDGWFETNNLNESLTEYTRTDAFIKKARKWFERQYEWYDKLGVRHCYMKDFEDFVKYMEGE